MHEKAFTYRDTESCDLKVWVSKIILYLNVDLYQYFFHNQEKLQSIKRSDREKQQ